jgi:hypothetical protein
LIELSLFTGDLAMDTNELANLISKHFYSGHTIGDATMQVFDCEAITDPAVLAALDKKMRRPRKRSPWFWRLLVTGAVAGALLVGILLGHYVL